MNVANPLHIVKIFVSSPSDVAPERGRVQAIASKLNRELEGLVIFETVLWEEQFYKADRGFQPQIPESAACDILVSIFWTRVGTELPADFARMPNGKPYPSGTAYELLTALAASKAKGVPDVYVFRKTADSTLPALANQRRQAQSQFEALEAFWNEWFQSEQGQFKAAFQTFISTDEFERQAEQLLRQWLQSQELLGPRLRWSKEKGSPFRGLAPFEAEHAAVFFGRDRAIGEARHRLTAAAERGTSFLLIVGASGVGKSSLARAGLIPRLITPGIVPGVDIWRVASMKPSDGQAGPLAALATALFVSLPELEQGDFSTPFALADHLRRGGAPAPRPILRSLARAGEALQRERHSEQALRPVLLLLVDQLEEVFAQAITEAERGAFVDCLNGLVATGQVWCVTTLRADLYELLLRQPGLKAMKEAGASFDLGPPGPAELAEIVRAPAAAAGLIFEVDTEHKALDERLLEDAKSPDSLPLLQFTLRQLYERRRETNGETLLTHAAYEALGKLQGAIAAEAERAVADLPAATLDALPRLVRCLAEPARDGTTLTLRAMPRDEVAADLAEATLVDALLGARILIAGQDAAGRPTLRLAHDAVLANWPKAKTAAQASLEFYRVRADVEDGLRRWREHGQRKDFLIQRGVPLAEAEKLLADFARELPPEITGYVKASQKLARARQRLVAAAATFFFALAVLAAVTGLVAYRAEEQVIAAQRRFAAAQQQANILDVLAGFIPEETEAAMKQSLESIRAGGDLDMDTVTFQQADALEEMARYFYDAWNSDKVNAFLKAADDLLGHVSANGATSVEFTRLKAVALEIAGDRNSDDDLTIPQALRDYRQAMQLFENIRAAETAGPLAYARIQRKLAALEIDYHDYRSADAHIAAAAELLNASNAAVSERAALEDVQAAEDARRSDYAAAQRHLEKAVALDRQALRAAIDAKQPILRLRATLASHLQHLGDALRRQGKNDAGAVYDEAEMFASEILETYPTQLATRFILDLIRHGRSLVDTPGTEPIKPNVGDNTAIDRTFGEGFGPFKFGMTPAQTNAALDRPFSSVDPLQLPRAREYRTGEVRYFWTSIGNLAAFRSFYEPVAPCLNANSDQVVFMFHENSLMRISFRLYGSFYPPRTDCGRKDLFPVLAQRFNIPLLGTPKEWRLRWETSRVSVIGTTHYDGPMLDIIKR